MPTALLLGATGAVGKALLKDVLQNGKYAQVVTIGRREATVDEGIPQDKLVQKVVDFENLNAHREAFRGVNDVFCCLGTTRADAGSAENFKRIDQGYVLESAKIIAEENPAPEGEQLSPVHFLYCSSANANKNALFLYPQSKGETEEGIRQTGFQRVSIFRPGFLEIETARSKPRWAEGLALSIFPPVNRFFNLHMSVPVTDVAKAMLTVAQKKENAAKGEEETTLTGSKAAVFSAKIIDELAARPLTQSSDEVLVVRNPYPEPRSFKVKTTAPKQYCVRPNAGRIEPNSKVEVHVILQPFKEEPPADFKCKDKFLVQTAIIKPEYESLSISEMWARVESEEKESIRQQKIKCVFQVPPEQIHHETKSEQSTLDNNNVVVNDVLSETPTATPVPVPLSPVPQRQQQQPAKQDLNDQLVRELNHAQDKITQLQKQLLVKNEQLERDENGFRARSQANGPSRKLPPTVQPQDAVHHHLAALETQRVTEGYPPQVVLIVAALVFVVTYLFF
ncbi:Oxidoreductase htatip2 [Apophysomyces sp. BC1015]|nr:Oxidoreductase htatip2 [Apophysomyces sp. BC1015]